MTILQNRSAIPACRARGLALAVTGLCLATGGCITVKAPDKPIVIELNVKIDQEIVYRLAGDAAQTINKNAEIF